MIEGVFESRYKLGPREINETPVIWINDDGEFMMNEAFGIAINLMKIPHEILVGDKVLDRLSELHLKHCSFSGDWPDPKATVNIEKIIFSWVERKGLKDDDGFGGIKLEIVPHKSYVWMINHRKTKDFNSDLQTWKARWWD